MPQFQERPHGELDERLVNPAEHCPDLAIGGFDHLKSVEGPGDGKGPDGGEFPEPVVEHHGFGQDTVAAQCAVQGGLQPAHRQRGTVPVAIGQDPRDEPGLPSQMKQWLENWKRVGPILEQERWDRLAAMSEEEAQLASWRVLELWQADWHGDDGEELLLHQRVFARARR